MAYFDKYGVEFSDDRKTLVRCPKDFEGEYAIPDTVTSVGNSAFCWLLGFGLGSHFQWRYKHRELGFHWL